MAEGEQDPGVQSDPESETEEHASPLDTMGSMTQSLMEIRPPKQRGTRTGSKARRRISKRRGAIEFLLEYEKRVDNRCTWPVKSLEESALQRERLLGVNPCLPLPAWV